MKNTTLLALSLSALILTSSSGTCWADGATRLAGSNESINPGQSKLITAMTDYYELCIMEEDYRRFKTFGMTKENARQMIFDLISREHGRGVNDREFEHGTAWAPLSIAMWCGDAEMVEHLIMNGAYPVDSFIEGTPSRQVKEGAKITSADRQAAIDTYRRLQKEWVQHARRTWGYAPYQYANGELKSIQGHGEELPPFVDHIQAMIMSDEEAKEEDVYKISNRAELLSHACRAPMDQITMKVYEYMGVDTHFVTPLGFAVRAGDKDLAEILCQRLLSAGQKLQLGDYYTSEELELSQDEKVSAAFRIVKKAQMTPRNAKLTKTDLKSPLSLSPEAVLIRFLITCPEANVGFVRILERNVEIVVENREDSPNSRLYGRLYGSYRSLRKFELLHPCHGEFKKGDRFSHDSYMRELIYRPSYTGELRSGISEQGEIALAMIDTTFRKGKFIDVPILLKVKEYQTELKKLKPLYPDLIPDFAVDIEPPPTEPVKGE